MTSSSLSFANDHPSTSVFSTPSHHWILQPCTLTDPKVIVLAHFEQSDYAVYLNPVDRRGYRSVVRLVNNDRMVSTINREYTSLERIGLALTMALVTEAQARIVPIAQNAVTGNNAHSFDLNTGTIQLGTLKEPIFLHGHVFGRGNPEVKYIEDISLDGPLSGLILDMRALSQQDPGNDKKLGWKSGEIEKVVHPLKTEIEKICDTYKVHGLTMIIQNTTFDIYIVRHSETDWNIEQRLQGHTDIPLNKNSIRQAQQFQEKFINIGFTKVFSSDLSRARSTAELMLDQTKQL